MISRQDNDNGLGNPLSSIKIFVRTGKRIIKFDDKDDTLKIKKVLIKLSGLSYLEGMNNKAGNDLLSRVSSQYHQRYGA